MMAENKEVKIKSLLREISSDVETELSLTIPELAEAAVDAPAVNSLREKYLDKAWDNIDWEEDPVSFERFVNDPYHMGQPKLSYRQAKAFKEFVGGDPKSIFTNPEIKFQIAVLLWGKGSGKDWICTLWEAYIIYVLLCMKNPHKFLSLAPDEAIDILNVAYSSDQAKFVYFIKFTNRIYSWPWLTDKYMIVEGRRVINKDKHPNERPSNRLKNYVRISGDKVIFPKGIRSISEHSESESYEGYNILFWVMDEAAAFRDKGKKANGHKVFSTLRTSAHSRFPSLWRGVIISYPRSEGDFMMTMYNMAKKKMMEGSKKFYVDKGSTWEINPTKMKSQFNDERDLDPVDYASKYECNPPPQEGAAFDPDACDKLLTLDRAPICDVKTSIITVEIRDPVNARIIRQKRIGKVITNINIHDLTAKQVPRVFHVDAGLSNCPASLILAHGEPCLINLPNSNGIQEEHVVNKTVVDQCIVWMPDKKNKHNVSINNIASVVQELSRRCNIVRGSYDQWNSESSIEALQASGIPVEKHNISSEDYGRLEVLINLGAVEIPYSSQVEWDILVNLGLKKIIQTGSGGRKKFEVGDGGYKDAVDCLCGVARLLNDPEIRGLTAGVTAPRIISGVPLIPAARSRNRRTRSDTILPDKVVNRFEKIQTEGNTIQHNIVETRERAKTHRLISGTGFPGDTHSLAYVAPANLGKQRAPKIILG